MGKGIGRAGALAKISGSNMSGGGNYFADGVYKCMVESIIYKEGHEGDLYIAECRILEAAPSIEGVKPSPVGSVASMVCNLTKHESAAGNAKSFVAQMLCGMGYTLDQFEGPPGSEQAAFALKMVEAASGPSNPFRGALIMNTTYRKTARESKKLLTLNKWSPIEGQTEATIKAGRDYLDKTPPTAQPAAPAPVAQPVATPTIPTTVAPNSNPLAGGPLAGLLK